MKSQSLSCSFALVAAIVLSSTLAANAQSDDLPLVAEGFKVDVIAKEPLVSNPCVMAFDKLGRICVAQGPQWRGPTPETPGDRVDILIDEDKDGIADKRKTFAEGLNSIQGIAWHGDDLWIANAPDLTVVRDTDGDDEADQYIRVYTGLGNLEHSLHGLNFGPDGKLYMSKGNSKGYNRMDQLAPKAFRELWGLKSPDGAPDYTEVKEYSKEDYKRAYHTPQDDWGQQGGILRCDPYESQTDKSSLTQMGRNLEIFARGFRNPWDICFDDGFNWLGTDNDQTEGDRVFAPFYGAHFGWGHPWSFDWKGIHHLPTVPISMPLYEGSGTGIIHYSSTHFPKEFQGVFFVNDWMRREVYLFRPSWNGAFLQHHREEFPDTFIRADGGRAMAKSSGRVFEPTDIEVGPDGALYILSWGHGYGGNLKDGRQVDAGRVYRIRHETNPLVPWRNVDRTRPHAELSMEELFSDLGSSVPAWRVDAQSEFLRRGKASIKYLQARLLGKVTKAQQTWALWTLGRLSSEELLNFCFLKKQNDGKLSEEVHLQVIRILGQIAPANVEDFFAWSSPNARLRHETVQAVRRIGGKEHVAKLLDLIAREQDRVVFYSAWNTMRALMSTDEIRSAVSNPRAQIRLAALLALFQDDSLSPERVMQLRTDPNPEVAELAEMWLKKTGNGSPLIELTPPPGEYGESISLLARSKLPRSFLTYTTDGSVPAMTSRRVKGPITIDRDTQLRFALFRDRVQAGPVTNAEYTIRAQKAYRHRQFAKELRSDSGNHYEFDWTGLAVGKRHYTDRDYSILEVPKELLGLPFIRMANADDRRMTDRLLSFVSDSDVTVMIGVDARNPEPLNWMRIGQPDGFRGTGLQLKTTDPVFNLFEKDFPAGEISLGANLNHPKASGRGNYLVILKKPLIVRSGVGPPVSMDEVLAKMPTADASRGRELFLHPQGAGCAKCHQMLGIGQVLGPDLSDIGSRAKSPEVLVESILYPSKVITEGFAQQMVLTVDGEVLKGSLLEETGRSLRIADSEGRVTTLNKNRIDSVKGTHTSAMPNGFATMMTSQQLADLTAWLLQQKNLGDKNGFWFQDSDDSLEIHYKQQRIATYLKRHDKLTRRALVNVCTPSGTQVTRNFPPRRPEDIDPGYKAEDRIIHPVMHAGIWIGFGDVDGNDYWRLKSKVEFDGFVQTPQGDRNTASFSTRNRYLREDGKSVVCEEKTTYELRITPEGLILKVDAEFQSDRDFYFGDQEESGLAIRVASPIRVTGGNGSIVNEHGDRNGAAIWGKEAQWFDYSGTIGDRQVGVMVASSPRNPRKSWLHARDYGVVVTNPFPKQPKERREPFIKTHVKAGEVFPLSYAILLHDLPAGQTLDQQVAAEQLLKLFEEDNETAKPKEAK